MARKHTAFYNIGFSEAKALFRQKLARKWGHAIARGWATLLLDRLRDFVVVPSSAGGNSSFELHSRTQSTEERVTLDRYHHFHGHSGMCARLLAFWVLFTTLLCFSVNFFIYSGPSSAVRNKNTKTVALLDYILSSLSS